jgi:hypothetical protein
MRGQTVGKFKRVELRVSALAVVSVISQDCDDTFWHFSKAFSDPITDSNTSRCQKVSCVKAPWHMLDDNNNHFNHKKTRDSAG